jgi:hypothetical protein
MMFFLFEHWGRCGSGQGGAAMASPLYQPFIRVYGCSLGVALTLIKSTKKFAKYFLNASKIYQNADPELRL